VQREDIDKVVIAAAGLRLEPRGDRWCHLSLCVIDAVFSIGARYGSTWRAARRYADHAALRPPTAPAKVVADESVVQTQQPLDAFLADVGGMSDDEFADVLGNRQRTSTRGGILKAAAAREYAAILVDHGVVTLEDVAALLTDHWHIKLVEAALARVRGHGSGVRISYLWMLAGDDHHVKADRMVIRWVEQALGRGVGAAEAAGIVQAAAEPLEVTPWALDHAIWRRQSGRTATAS